ncbi:hypothetical protein L7F22_038947 [Adiantum nelumboides]|nr:hypothetical protein [Adiantum nelumboides]
MVVLLCILVKTRLYTRFTKLTAYLSRFQSESDVSSPFGYGFGKRRFAAITSSEDDKQSTRRPVPPLLRRLRTDATQATSIGSMMENDSVKSRILTETTTEEPNMMDEDDKSEISSSVVSSILTEDEGDETIQPKREITEPLKREKSVAFSALTRSSTRATKKSNTSTVPPTPPRKDVPLPFIDDSTVRPRSPLRKPILDTPEAGVSPSLLGTPKRAKDLIQFFEQTSAPNSPSLSRTSTSKPTAKQLSPMKGESPAQMASRFRQALGSSGLSNRITIEGTNENVLNDDDVAIQEKITTVGRGNRRRARAGGLVGITVGGEGGGQDPFSSSYDSNIPNSGNNENEEESDEDEENHLPSVLTGQPRLPGDGKKTEEAQDAPGRTSDGGGGGSGGTGKGSNNSPFRSGVKNIIKALSQGVYITGADAPTSRGGSGGGGGGGDQGGRKTSWQGAHQTGVPPPSSFRDPSQLINMRRQSSSELTDLQSVLSTRTVEKPIWQRAQAVLLPSALALSWIPTGGGRVSVILDLSACREVHSVPGPDHPSSGDDAGAFVAREQGLRRINPFQLIFNDGVERLAVDTARERVMWVASVWDSLGVRSSSNQQPRSRQVSANYSTIGGMTDMATDIADVHMTTPRPSGLPMSPLPPNFNVQLSDSPVRRLIPSGLAAIPLESSLEDVTQIQTSSPDRGRYEAVSAIAAEMVPPPLPPKEKQKRKRFIDEPIKPESPPNVDSDESKHSQETLVLNEDRPEAIRGRAQDTPPNNVSHSDRDIVPADSASQRPSRSLTGTILSRFSALAGYRSEKVEEAKEEESPPRTPAQNIRDQFVGGEMEEDLDEPPLTARTLDTVVEETLSQAALTSVQSPQQANLGSTSKSFKQKKGGPGSLLSIQTSGSVSSQELARLLQFIEQQNEDRDRRERQMEEQFRAFQETIINLQEVAHHQDIAVEVVQKRSDATAAAAATVAADAASLAAMQEKLDRVLSLVGNVTEGQHRLENATEDDRMVHGTHAANRRMSAPADMEQDELSEGNDGFLTPMTGERAGLPPSDMADLYSPAVGMTGSTGMIPPSHSEGSMVSESDRIPARSWISADGIPSPPTNTEHGASLLNAERRGPVERSAYGMINSARSQYDPLAPGDSLSNVSIDMEAEVRRRRMRNAVGARNVSSSQQLQQGGWYTPRQGAMESGGQRSTNPDIALLLDAIKDNEDARKAQRQQQQDIARYLNELNSWLEKDVIDRSKEWRTLAMGVTQLHDELNTIRTQAGLATTSAMPGVMAMADGGGDAAAAAPVGRNADPGGLMAMPMPQAHQAPHPDGAAPHISFADNTYGGFAPQAAHEYGNNAGLQGPRGMPTPDVQQPSAGILHPSQAAQAEFGGQMPLTSQALAQLGADAPAPLNVPRPGSPVKRSGTRTWRSQNAPTPLRNDDVWQNSGAVPDKKKEKEDKKAEKRANRRKSFGKIVAGAVGAALAGAAMHEWDKHKDRQRKEGKPEEASKEPDVKTGEHVKLDHVPAPEQEKITKAAQSGDEDQIRKVISDASAAGFGKPAIVQMAEDLRKMSAPEGENTQSDDQTLRNSYDSQGTATKMEVGEDEQRIRQAQADAEAMREEERRQEMEDRESRLSTLRDQERSELVETIFAKMQAEKDRADAEAAARQREMDPKSAIESLVAAINTQRQADASQRAAADLAVKQMAEDLVRTTSDANSKLVEAVHAAAREMLRNNVEAHADDLKRLIGRDVSMMFEDVGKIREAKRALELEMSELFSFKSKHLAEIEQMKLANAASSAMPMAQWQCLHLCQCKCQVLCR